MEKQETKRRATPNNSYFHGTTVSSKHYLILQHKQEAKERNEKVQHPIILSALRSSAHSPYFSFKYRDCITSRAGRVNSYQISGGGQEEAETQSEVTPGSPT